MKELERFWQWYDAEKPDALRARHKLEERVLEHDSLGCRAIELAVELIDRRAHGHAPNPRPGVTLCEFPQALRDLSLALLPAIERMYEQVPEHRSESLGQWLSPKALESVAASTGELRVGPRAEELPVPDGGVSSYNAVWGTPVTKRIYDRLEELQTQPVTRVCTSCALGFDSFAAARARYCRAYHPEELPKPQATPQADGTHCEDVMCHCRSFILKPDGCHVTLIGTHTEKRCWS